MGAAHWHQLALALIVIYRQQRALMRHQLVPPTGAGQHQWGTSEVQCGTDGRLTGAESNNRRQVAVAVAVAVTVTVAVCSHETNRANVPCRPLFITIEAPPRAEPGLFATAASCGVHKNPGSAAKAIQRSRAGPFSLRCAMLKSESSHRTACARDAINKRSVASCTE